MTHDLREAVFLSDVIYVMAAFPGHLVHVHEVPLPRPRTLADVYGAEATRFIRQMHGEIRPMDRAVAAGSEAS